jgi:phospholipid/cholesterol/gamma-HCH transport system substrate-binding protein
MITKEQKFRLGVFLVVSFLLLVAILAILIIPKLKENGYTYFINFKGTSVNGVNQGADVKYQGVKVGKVSELEVNPENLDSVLIYVRIKQSFSVKEDMRAALQYAGITGLRFVEISGGKAKSSYVLPGGEIRAKKGLGEKAEDIVLNIDSVVDAVNQILNTENRDKFAQMLKNLEASTRVTAQLLESREKNLSSTVGKLDDAMTHIVELSKNLQQFTDYMNKQSQQVSLGGLAKKSEKLLDTISKRLSKEEFGQVMNNTNRFLETANISLRKFETQFHNMEGEFSKSLVSLRESMENLAQFTRELTEDPTVLIRKRSGKKGSKK